MTLPHSQLSDRLRDTARRHWLFLAVLSAGAALRVLTAIAYRPALLFIDSFKYLDNQRNLDPTVVNPLGYNALFLKPVLWVGNLATVVYVQHALGLAMGIATYALLLRFGVSRWLAAAGTAPVLLDAYQIQIEHNVMSDAFFEALVLGAILVMCWRRDPSQRALAVAGLLLGLAVSVRLVGIVLVVPAVIFVACTSIGWARLRRAGIVVLAFATPLLAYAIFYDYRDGHFKITASDSGTLYGRAVVIVDCPSLSMPSYERALCPTEPLGKRPPDRYAHNDSMLLRVTPPPGITRHAAQRDFALRVFVQQPVDLLKSVWHDFVHGFDWSRTSGPYEVTVERWQFQTTYPMFRGRDPVGAIQKFGGGGPSVNSSVAAFLRSYQLNVGWVPGPFLAAAFIAGLIAAVGVGPARRSRLRAPCFLVTTSGLGLLVLADFFEFSWRYQLPGFVLAPIAGALGVTALTARSKLPDGLDEVDQAAIADFRSRYADATLAPVVVVIPAYQEAATIRPVLDELPHESLGLRVDRLVVVDGATDATADAAERGAYVCVAATNRGQGAALRLGYQIARECGGRFIVTTDADGQYDGSELPRVVAPLVEDRADFVTGSRWLGQQETTDRVRRAGSWLFARLATLMTHHRITDTSFGFRAMRAEVTAAVTLHEPQYQSSELLIGVLALGYRVVECPMTIRPRRSGRTKKGNNLLYGLRFARVLVGTWLREWGRHRRTRRARGRNAVPDAEPFAMTGSVRGE
jgi:hypothetical protein